MTKEARNEALKTRKDFNLALGRSDGAKIYSNVEIDALWFADSAYIGWHLSRPGLMDDIQSFAINYNDLNAFGFYIHNTYRFNRGRTFNEVLIVINREDVEENEIAILVEPRADNTPLRGFKYPVVGTYKWLGDLETRCKQPYEDAISQSQSVGEPA